MTCFCLVKFVGSGGGRGSPLNTCLAYVQCICIRRCPINQSLRIIISGIQCIEALIVLVPYDFGPVGLIVAGVTPIDLRTIEQKRIDDGQSTLAEELPKRMDVVG